MKTIFILLGLVLNTAASLIAIYPLLKTTRKIDDDYIVSMDKKGNYTQRKHIQDQRTAIFCLCLLATGFVFQIIGEMWKK